MPCAPRPSKRCQRIVDDIIGTPPNMRQKKKRKQSESQERLVQQDTRLVR